MALCAVGHVDPDGRRGGPHIPQELFDMFLDHLHDNKPALATCALVSKSWARSSRRHLFRFIYVHLEVRTFSEFADWIEKIPHIHHYVRHLYLEGDTTLEWEPVERSPCPPISLSSLSRVVGCLPYLSHLTLEKVPLPHDHTDPSAPPPLTKLATLEYKDTCDLFTAISRLVLVVGLFQNITTLKVKGHFWRENTAVVPQAALADTTVERLVLGCGHICRELQRCLSLVSLRDVAVDLDSWVDVVKFGELLCETGSSIESLEFDFIGAINTTILHQSVIQSLENGELWSALSMSSCSSLKSFTTSFLVEEYGSYGMLQRMHYQWNALIYCLSHVSRTLCDLTIKMSIWTDGKEELIHYARRLDWTGMDGILAATHNLQTVTFGFEIGGTRTDKATLFDEYRDVVKGYLPRQVERGAVRFDRDLDLRRVWDD